MFLPLLINLSEALGFNFDKIEVSEDELTEKINIISNDLGKTFSNMEEILQYRKIAREQKNWELADKIRLIFDKAGIVLKDSKDGTTWELK